jgi:glycogen debranching enzyme
LVDRLVLKENDIFAVTDGEGNILANSIDGHGLYYADTRYLSVYELAIDGVPLQLLSAGGELNFMNNFQFANLPTTLPNGVSLRARALSVRRNRFIDRGLHERIGIQNYGAEPVSLAVRLALGSDFRDMFDVRGYVKRPARGTVNPPEHMGKEIQLGYVGRDEVQRTTLISLSVEPAGVQVTQPAATAGPRKTEGTDGDDADPRVDAGPPPLVAEAVFDVDLAPGEIWSLTISMVPSVVGASAKPPESPSLDASFGRILAEHEDWESSCTRIVSDYEPLNMLIRRSLRDLRLLVNQLPTGLLPVAGIPWFAVPFGRDSIITSLQTLCLNPDIAYGTLRFLALHQGKQVDPWRDEEPGKILHEMRCGEMAALREVPQTPYYGSVDSTPLFVCLFGELLRWTDDWELARELHPHLDQALEWLYTYGDQDHDGLVEYHSHSTGGIHNQGWKDSFDSIAFPDRTLAEPPIAVAEVQGYAYAAERAMADAYRRLGDVAAADRCVRQAEERKRRFDEAFWLESEGFYAIALDAQKRQVPAISSNPGHCFLTGLLDGPRADAAARRLIQPDMRCGWGVRTLSSAYPTFNPMSYHNGSIWPHDNSIVAAGLRRAGYDEAALSIVDEVLSAAFRMPDYRLPELFCGFSRDLRYQSVPAAYPVSCSPQAWAAGSVFLMLQHLLGLEPDLPNGRLSVRPALLPWLDELHFDGIRLGSRIVDVHTWREGSEIKCEVRGAEGLDVSIAPVAYSRPSPPL